MNEQRLRELLRGSDDTGRPPAARDLLAGVRGRLRVRARRRAGVTVAATILLVSTLVVTQRLERPGPEIVAAPPVEQTAVQAGVVDYAAEADLRAAIARRMIAGEAAAARIRALEAELARPLPSLGSDARTQVELAAATLFRAGERVRSEVQTAAAGCRQYQAVVDVYPETAWAQLARRRLADCSGS